MPIFPIFLVFSYMVGFIFTSMSFNKELIYYRTSLAGPLATTVDSECLILATKTYDLSMSQATSGLHSRASSVCSLFGTLFTGRHASVASYASCLFGVFTNSMHVFFNLFLLAGLNARMRPGSTGRFYISAVVFGSAAFNLFTIGSLLVRTPWRAAASLYNNSTKIPFNLYAESIQVATVDLTKAADGCYSAVDATQASDLSFSMNNNGFFSRKTLLYTIGVVTMAGLLWVGKSHFFPSEYISMINGVPVKVPFKVPFKWIWDNALKDVWPYQNALSDLERARFESVGVSVDMIPVNRVTGRFAVCYYYKQSFLRDFKDKFLAFHGLAPGAQVDWMSVFITKVSGYAESYKYACDITPKMSFKDSTTLVVNLLQEKIYFGIGVER